MRVVICIALLLGLMGIPGYAFGDEAVRGHMRRDGTYVQPYHRSSPNSTPTDNYNFKGNINPWTGKEGSDYYRENPRSPYYDGSQRGRVKDNLRYGDE